MMLNINICYKKYKYNSYFQACDKFYYCSDGIPNELPCPPGLYFDEETSNCDWKESVNRRCEQITKGKLKQI